MRLHIVNTILTPVLLPLSCMVNANSTQNNKNNDTSTSETSDRPEDTLTGGGTGKERQATEVKDNTEKKRAKVAYGGTVSIMATNRRRQTAVTKIHRITGASTQLADGATANKKTGVESRDWAGFVQSAGPTLNFETIELATTDPGITEFNTFH